MTGERQTPCVASLHLLAGEAPNSGRSGRWLRPAVRSREQEGHCLRGLSRPWSPQASGVLFHGTSSFYDCSLNPKATRKDSLLAARVQSFIEHPQCAALCADGFLRFILPSPHGDPLRTEGDSAMLSGWPRVTWLGWKWRNQDRNLQVLFSSLIFQKDRSKHIFQTPDWT